MTIDNPSGRQTAATSLYTREAFRTEREEKCV